MTLETLSRPPVVDFLQQDSPIKPPVIDLTAFSDLSPQRRKVLELINSAGGQIARNSFFQAFYPDGIVTSGREGVVRTLVRHAKNSLREKTGQTIQLTDDFQEYRIVDQKDLRLPNGKPIDFPSTKQQEIFEELAKRFDMQRGLDPAEIYPNAERGLAERNLDSIVVSMRKHINDPDYAIASDRDETGRLTYFLRDKRVEDKFTLPNGLTITGLTQQKKAIVQFLASGGIIFMQDLASTLKPGVSYKKARERIRTEIYGLRKLLAGVNMDIKLATTGQKINPAYILLETFSANNPTPFAKSNDAYIKQRIDKITTLLEAQQNDKPLTLTDEVNAQLNNELQQLRKEVKIRRLIEEKKRAKIEEWNRKQNGPKKDDFVDEPENEYEPIVRFTRIRYLFSDKGLPNKVLDEAGQEAFEKAKENFNPENGFSFEEYAEFWIRGAMGNMLLYNSPEAPETEHHGFALPNESITGFKKDFTIALVDLSSRRRYPKNFITPYESRALDIMRGITGKNPGSSEDVAYEFDSSIQWAERLVRTGMEKLMNSSHAPTLAKYLSS